MPIRRRKLLSDDDARTLPEGIYSDPLIGRVATAGGQARPHLALPLHRTRGPGHGDARQVAHHDLRDGPYCGARVAPWGPEPIASEAGLDRRVELLLPWTPEQEKGPET